MLVLGGKGGKEDSGFDGHREDDFFDQSGFGSSRVGDGGAMEKQAEARFADAEEFWESRARAESGGNNDGARGKWGFFIVVIGFEYFIRERVSD